MVCCCICCGGKGACSNLLSLIITLVFSSHLIGITSPKWYCDGPGCTLQGPFYSCDDADCERKVTDATVLTLALLVLCSNFLLILMFCCIVQCTSYKYKPMGPMIAISIGGWFVMQEIISFSILMLIQARYDKMGWSAWCFTLPGVVASGIVIFMLIYQLCWPEKNVHPDDRVY